VVALIGSTAFLVAGSFLWTLALPAVLCLVLTAVYRPWRRLDERADGRALEWMVTAVAGLMALQLVPLPAPLIDSLSPAARSIWQHLSLGPVDGPLPISVDLSSTAWALGVYAGTVLTFLVCRRLFASGGVRVVARGIATIGLILSAVCLAQEATAHGLIYWRWQPPFEVAAPFGPFLNRNHFATWTIMAVPLAIGYLLAHGAAHERAAPEHAHWRAGVPAAIDARSLWLAAAICLMLVALVASLSRSGMAAMLIALALGAYWRNDGVSPRASRWLAAALALAALAAIVRINPVDLYHRFGAVGTAASGRLAIWRATLPVVKDFWLTGTGAGSFETVMLAYQRTPSLFRINAAHNHYLQVAAEGGLLIGVPAAIALVLFGRAAWRAVTADASRMRLLRVGALSGLAGVAVQSLWETGLATPANALLAATLAALVVHQSERPVSAAD
jgi:O-antigen ligase